MFSIFHKNQILGIFFLMTVVILWVASAFVNQAVFTQIGYPKPLSGTCVQGSLTVVFLIPIVINFCYRRHVRTVKAAECARRYSKSRLKLFKVRQLIRDLKPAPTQKNYERLEERDQVVVNEHLKDSTGVEGVLDDSSMEIEKSVEVEKKMDSIDDSNRADDDDQRLHQSSPVVYENILNDIDHKELEEVQTLVQTAIIAIPLGLAWLGMYYIIYYHKFGF